MGREQTAKATAAWRAIYAPTREAERRYMDAMRERRSYLLLLGKVIDAAFCDAGVEVRLRPKKGRGRD